MEFYNSTPQPIGGKTEPISLPKIQHTGPVPPVLPYLGIGTSSPVAGLREDQQLEALQHQDWSVRVAAARALGKLGERTPIDALISGLADTHKAVRAAAARALGSCGAELPIAPLVEALHDSDWHVRAAAVMALGKQKGRAPVEPLTTLLQDEDEAVRGAAAWAVGELGERAPTGPLIAALRDSAPSVREAAVSALGALGTRAPLGPLLALRDDEDASVLRAVEIALQQTHPELFTPHEANTDALAIWDKRTSEDNAAQKAPEDQAHTQTVIKEPGLSPLEQIWKQRRQTSSSRVAEKATHYSSEAGARGKRQHQPTAKGSFLPASTFSWSRLAQVLERSLVAAVLLGMCASWLALGYRLHPSSTASQYISTLFSYHSLTGSIAKVLWAPGNGAINQDNMPFIAFSDANGRVQVWNMSKKQYATAYGAFNQETVLSFVWTSNGLEVAFKSHSGNIELVRANDNDQKGGFMQIPMPSDATPVASWSPDGKRIAIAWNEPADSSIHVWDTTTKSEVATHTTQGGTISSIVWSPDGTTIASAVAGGQAGSIEIWESDTGKSVLSSSSTPYWSEPFKVLALAWSPDGQRLAYLLSDGEVRWRDQRTDIDTLLTQANSSLPEAKAPWNGALSWSPDGQRLASSTPGGTIQVWDTNSGNLLYIFNGHTYPVTDIAWSSDGKQIASASSDGTLLVWGSV